MTDLFLEDLDKKKLFHSSFPSGYFLQFLVSLPSTNGCVMSKQKLHQSQTWKISQDTVLGNNLSSMLLKDETRVSMSLGEES
jgi:hypothetical protein